MAGFACMVALKARAAARLTALFLFLFFFVFITFSSAGRDSSSWGEIQQESWPTVEISEMLWVASDASKIP